MGILDTIKGLRGNESQKPAYSFEIIDKALLREDRSKIAELIAQVNAVETPAEKIGPWKKLTDFVTGIFADVGVPVTDSAVTNFISTFGQSYKTQNYSETAPTPMRDAREQTVSGNPSVLETDSTAADPATRIVPTRVTPWNQLEGIEPVAAVPATTANIISAQQRGLGVTANPEASSAKGEKYLNSFIEEARLRSNKPAGSAVKYIPHPGDTPQFEAKNDSVPGSANIDWIPPDHTKTIHPKPPEHLIK